MLDGHGRRISYLRVSVTDRCNLRCRYCMPESGVALCRHEEILRYDEIVRLVRIMAGLGIARIRLTGGEPLVRRDLPELVRQLRQIEGIEFLGVTTNGLLLPEQAADLHRAGVDGLNISLDTTNRERYREITRFDNLERAMQGIHTALGLPFRSVKINAVLSPYSAEEDWLGVVGLAKDLPVDVRLIEWMPMAGEAEERRCPEAQAVLTSIRQRYGPLLPLPPVVGGGPARYWRAQGFRGRIGMIHAMSRCFCGGCNRIRLTSTGDLKLCLFYDMGVSLRDLLRSHAGDEEIRYAIRAAVAQKPREHRHTTLPDDGSGVASHVPHLQGMFKIGG